VSSYSIPCNPTYLLRPSLVRGLEVRPTHPTYYRTYCKLHTTAGPLYTCTPPNNRERLSFFFLPWPHHLSPPLCDAAVLCPGAGVRGAGSSSCVAPLRLPLPSTDTTLQPRDTRWVSQAHATAAYDCYPRFSFYCLLCLSTPCLPSSCIPSCASHPCDWSRCAMWGGRGAVSQVMLYAVEAAGSAGTQSEDMARLRDLATQVHSYLDIEI
jgi:hypothetical protein